MLNYKCIANEEKRQNIRNDTKLLAHAYPVTYIVTCNHIGYTSDSKKASPIL